MQEYSRPLGDAVKRARGKLELTQNEVANAAFRNHQIPFTMIEDIVIGAVHEAPFTPLKSVDDLLAANAWGDEYARGKIRKLS